MKWNDLLRLTEEELDNSYDNGEITEEQFDFMEWAWINCSSRFGIPWGQKHDAKYKELGKEGYEKWLMRNRERAQYIANIMDGVIRVSPTEKTRALKLIFENKKGEWILWK